MANTATTSADLCIIGAGISGLTTLKNAVDAGLNPVCLERESRAGGVWSRPQYQTLRVQYLKTEFAFKDLDWDSTVGDYPSYDDVRAYIKEYVARFDLSRYIRYGVDIENCTFADDSETWTVHLKGGSQVQCPWLAMCTGSLTKHRGMPKGPWDEFDGELLHSSEYVHAAPYKDKSVVVLGWGASALEITADLANNGGCKNVTLLSRVEAPRGQDWVLPRRDAEGCPLRFSSDGSEMTNELRNDRVEKAARAAAGGDYYSWVPEALRPQLRPMEGRIICSECFIHAGEAGKVKVVEGECTGFKGRHLQYRTDKGKCHALHDVDAIVCAIGYAPFLPRLQGLMSPAPQESEWHLGMWSPTVPKCAFVGFGFGFVSIPFLVDLQSQYLLRCVRDPALLSEMASLPTGQNFTDNRYIRSLLPPTTEAGATPAKAAPVAPLKIDPVQAPKQAADPATPASPVSGASGSALASPLSPTGSMIAESNYKIGGGTVAELYDLWAQDYDTDAEDSMAFDSPKEMAALFAFLHRFNGPSGSTKILDAGCGTGLLQRYAAAVPNCEWHGMDLSEGMLQVLKKKGGYETLHAHSISDYPWPYPDEFADVVLCNGVLIYVDDPTCLNEFLRVTKPGGTLYLMVREDGRATYWETMCAHEQSNAWRLKYITEPRENMPLKPQGIIYRIYVYQKAAAPKVSAAGR